MKQTSIALTDECFQVLEAMREDRSLAEEIERHLWKSRVFQYAAKQLGLTRPVRKKPGRPVKSKNK